MQITTEVLTKMVEKAKQADKGAREIDLLVAETHEGQLPGGLYELAIRRSAKITTLEELLRYSKTEALTAHK